ncbi:hypothetical protein D3C72_1365900 [compost metagenome]
MRQAQVDFVDDGKAIPRLDHLVDLAQLGRGDGAASRVAGRRQQYATCPVAPGGAYLVGAQLKTLCGRGGQQHGIAFRCAHKVAIAGVARIGHQNFVTRIDERQAHQLQRGRCARGDDDAAGRNINAKALRIPGRQRLAQRRNAQRRGVLRQAALDGLAGGFLHQGGRGEIRLADVQEDHGIGRARHLGRQCLGGLGHFHHIERFNAVGTVGNLHGLCNQG